MIALFYDENVFVDGNNVDTPEIDDGGSFLDNEEGKGVVPNVTSDYVHVMLRPGEIMNKTMSEEIMKQEVIDYLDSSMRDELSWFMK